MASPYSAPDTSPGLSLSSFIPSEPEEPKAASQAPTPEPAPTPAPRAEASIPPAPAPQAPQAPEAPEPEDTTDYGPVAAGQGELPRSAQAVARRMTEAGYDTHHIAGVLGVLQQESGLDNMSVGDNETSFGVAQWHASRLTALGQFARDRNIDPYDADTQAQYIVHELNGPEARAGQDLMAQTGAAGAARVWRAEFERPQGNYDDAAIAAASRFQPAIQRYVQSLRNGQADRQDVADGTINGTADGTGGPVGQGTTLDPVSRMMGLVGGNADTAAPFIKAGGGSLDPRKDNYCAAFTNSALAQAGIRGSNSNVATSFLNWGSNVPSTDDLQRNDVVVIPRDHPVGELGGHVGLATGALQDGANGPEIQVVSGNTQHGHIAVEWYPVNDVVVRRSDTANTQGQDPQSAGPNVAPTLRRTTNATYQVNGMTLPDLDRGAPLPHGGGAPMDPQDAAMYHQANAPEGLGPLLSNFGGAIADTAAGLGKDFATGHGPIGSMMDNLADWAGKQTGLDLSWLHSAHPGILPPGLSQVAGNQIDAAINWAQNAAYRVAQYDPNAAKSGYGELGYNLGLVASMIGGGVGSDIAKAGTLGGKVLAAGKGLFETGAGGATLTEAPEIIKDATGSEVAGEASSAALAALLGLRVPILEKLASPVASIAKGLGENGARFGAGGGKALENLTPSQMTDVADETLRKSLSGTMNRADQELSTLGNPSAWANAGTTDANLTRGAELYAQTLGNTIDAARAVGRGLYNDPAIDKTVMQDFGRSHDTAAAENEKFLADKAAFGRPDSDFPADILNNVFKTSSPSKMVSTGILGPDNQPIMRPLAGTGVKGLGPVDTLGTGIEKRSQIEQEIRRLQGISDQPGVRSQIGILQRVSQAMGQDINDLSNGGQATQDAVAALQKANKYHAALSDIMGADSVANVLARGYGNSRDALDAANAAKAFLQAGPGGIAGMRPLQKLVELQGGDPTNLMGFMKDIVRQDFMKSAAYGPAQNVNLPAATQWLKRHGQLLDAYMPDVKIQIAKAMEPEADLTQALGKTPGQINNPYGSDNREIAAANWLEAPTATVLQQMEGRPMGTQKAMFARAMARLGGDPQGDAFNGFRQTMVNRMLDGAQEKGIVPAIQSWMDKNPGIISAMSEGPDPTFRARLSELTSVKTKSGLMAAIGDLVPRFIGTRLGNMINRSLPEGGMAGGLSMASGGVNIARQLTKDWKGMPFANQIDVVRTILANPDAAQSAAKLGGMDLNGVAQSLKQQFTAGELLSAYLQRGATPAAFALQHALNDYRRQNGDPNAPPPGYLGSQPGPAGPAR